MKKSGHFKTPLRFLPNFQKGKTVPHPLSIKESRIQKMITLYQQDNAAESANICKEKEISERWIVSDDTEHHSRVLIFGRETIPFPILLDRFGELILGKEHIREFGPNLKILMKILETHPDPQKGSSSVFVHPAKGHLLYSPKIKIWKGEGKIYLGWNKDTSEKRIRTFAQNGTLELDLNPIQMEHSHPVFIPGGVPYALRSGTLVLEWSSVPEKNHSKEECILYDRTDGKIPSPRAENIETALELIKQADLFHKTEDFFCKSRELFTDGSGNRISLVLENAELFVEEIEITTSMELSTEMRGFPLFMEKGKVEVIQDGVCLDILFEGDERFFPCCLGKVTLISKGEQPALMQKWYAPFSWMLEDNLIA